MQCTIAWRIAIGVVDEVNAFATAFA